MLRCVPPTGKPAFIVNKLLTFTKYAWGICSAGSSHCRAPKQSPGEPISALAALSCDLTKACQTVPFRIQSASDTPRGFANPPGSAPGVSTGVQRQPTRGLHAAARSSRITFAPFPADGVQTTVPPAVVQSVKAIGVTAGGLNTGGQGSSRSLCTGAGSCGCWSGRSRQKS